MGSLSLVHWMIILLVVLLLFGGSRLSGVMGDFAKGIKAFKEGLREDEHDRPVTPQVAPQAQLRRDEVPPQTDVNQTLNQRNI